MNKGKILISLIGIIVIATLIFIIYKIIVSPNVNDFKIILIDNKIEVTDIEQISTNIFNQTMQEDFNISFSFHGQSFDEKFSYPTFTSDSIAKKLIFDLIKSKINLFKITSTTNLNETANNQIEDLARVLSNINKETSVVIAGKFPICYDNENMNKAISNFKKNLTIKNKDLIEINWMVQSNSEEPENIFFDYLKNLGIKFLDNQITVAKRVCPSSSRKVYSIFFNPIDSSDVQNFEKLLTSNYGKDLKLKIWNDSKINDSIISINNGIIKPNDKKLLSELSKGQWTSIGYLIKQATNEFEAIHDTVSKDLLIVAPMPLESRGSVINPEVWTTLSKLKNLNVYFVSSSNLKLNQSDKGIKNAFKKYATKFTELNF